MHAQLVVDHAPRVIAHLAGADRMIGGLRGALARSRAISSSDCACGPGPNSSGSSHAIAGASNSRRTMRIARRQAFAVAALGEEIEMDRRRLARVRGLDVDAAAALRAQLMRDHRDAGFLGDLHVGCHQHRLDRQHRRPGVESLAALDEGAHRRGRMAEEALAPVM